MTAFDIKLETGQGRGGGGIVYSEGTASLTFPFLPRTDRLLLPNAALWQELLPPFVKDRREEVLPRVLAYCRRFSWLKLAEAQKKEELGCILLVEKEPFNVGYFGNPENPLYFEFDQAQEDFEKSRPVI